MQEVLDGFSWGFVDGWPTRAEHGGSQNSASNPGGLHSTQHAQHLRMTEV